nr:MAG TPA: hypothetical protein [Caudoviricetes sp.]
MRRFWLGKVMISSFFIKLYYNIFSVKKLQNH